MTRDQRELVRLSLDRLSEEADPVTLLLYGKLFELDPSVRRLFHNDLTAQGGRLMDTLDAVASSPTTSSLYVLASPGSDACTPATASSRLTTTP